MATVGQKPAPLSQTHPFTCNTCQVAFKTHEAQRNHHHSDWHQYNLKRKVASLPPLSSETFSEKVLHAQKSTQLEKDRATFAKSCAACNKTYYSENGYINHIGSSKHRQNVAAAQMSAIRAGGSGKAQTLGRKQDDKDETESVVSSTFSMGEPVSKEEPVNELVAEVKNLAVSNDSTPTPSEAAAKSEAGEKEGEEKEDEEEDQIALPLEACLFCPYISPSLPLNVSHMTKAHGLFIPESQYLVDLPGLITYLGQKLVYGNQCLYCNKTKGGLEGIRTHMQDKGHTMLGFETEEQQVELGQYYDFRATYSDGEDSGESDEEWEDEEGEEGEAAEGEGEGWETDSDTSVDSAQLGAIPLDREGRRARGASHKMQDGFHSHAHSAVFHDEYELHLPSGRSVGHRSLARFYRQNLRDHPLPPVRRAVDYRAANEVDDEEEGGVRVNDDGTVMNRRERREEARAVARRGELGMLGATDSQKRDVAKLHKQAQADEARGRRRFERGVNRQANFQKHYRDPLLQ